MSVNSRITAQSKRIVRLLTMNRDEQRRRLEAEARVAELEAALENILRAMPPTTVYIGYACNQYHATYAAHGSDPFKEARAALAKEGE